MTERAPYENDRWQTVSTILLDSLRGLMAAVRSYFLTGVILVVPVGVTIFIVLSLFQFADSILGDWIRSGLGLRIPGLGLISTFLIFVLAGAFAQNVIGKSILRWIDFSLSSVPVVRSLYVGVKQVSDVILKQKSSDFQRVVLVEFPKTGSYSLAFVTGDFPITRFAKGFETRKMVSVFVPTTPNPTSGYLLVVNSLDIVDTTLGVEEAMKIVISGGLVKPNELSGGDRPDHLEEFTIPH